MPLKMLPAAVSLMTEGATEAIFDQRFHYITSGNVIDSVCCLPKRVANRLLSH